MAATRSERVSFQSAYNHQIAARLDRPETDPSSYALLAHCFTCSKDLKAATWISRTLAKRGIAVLRFDFTGLGESEGDFSDTSFSSNLDDLVAAADYLRSEHRAPRMKSVRAEVAFQNLRPVVQAQAIAAS